MSRFVLAIDQGTTGSTVTILDDQGSVLSKVNQEYRQIFPQPGWVEHDPEDIWGSVVSVLSKALRDSKVDPSQIKAIGITNQRETTIVWDRKTGREVYNAIVWQCRRTADICAKLRKKGLEKKVKKKTGLVLDPYFSGTKIQWILDNVPDLRAKAKRRELAFGTVDTFLLWKLTSGQSHCTDVSNASRTLLMNLKTLNWDPELLKIFNVPSEILPEIKPSIGEFGVTKGVPGLPDGIPITGIAGDQQAALFGQACFQVGEAKCTFGTGSFVLLNTGNKIVESKTGCLTTVAWQWGDKVTYALEGSAFICGAAVQWLRDGMNMIHASPDIEDLAKSVSDCGGVQFLPALAGLGSPHWDSEARGLICGLTRGATKAHLARATLEGMALQNAELLLGMQGDLKKKLALLKVDGGASKNNLLMQMQADFTGVRCLRPKNVETTSAGAAFMAGLGAGIWKNYFEIQKVWHADHEFVPELPQKLRLARLEKWGRAIKASKLISS